MATINMAAQALGKLRAASKTKKQHAEWSKAANEARWGKKRKSKKEVDASER